MHHQSVELVEPVMSFSNSEIHKRNSELSFLMVTMHNFDNQYVRFQHVETSPQVLHRACFYGVAKRGISHISVTEKSFRTYNCVSFLPFF